MMTFLFGGICGWAACKGYAWMLRQPSPTRAVLMLLRVAYERLRIKWQSLRSR